MRIEVEKIEKGFLSAYSIHTWWSLSARHHPLENCWRKFAISFIQRGTYELENSHVHVIFLDLHITPCSRAPFSVYLLGGVGETRTSLQHST